MASGATAPAPRRFGASTSSAPAKPTKMPSQRRPDTRSSSRGPASAPVRSGCSPEISAATAADRPCSTAQNTQQTYNPCISAPATRLSRQPAQVRGQGAPVARAMADRTVALHANRSVTKVSGLP